MSGFFPRSDSSSEEELVQRPTIPTYTYEEEVSFFSRSDSSSEEELVQRPTIPTYTISDYEEEAKRYVRSMKRREEKRCEELTNIIELIKIYKEIEDISCMVNSFEELQEAFVKAAPAFSKLLSSMGQKFRKYLKDFEDLSKFRENPDQPDDKEYDKGFEKLQEAFVKTTRAFSKSISPMKQKLRKYLKDFEDLSKFRENPDQPADKEDDKKEVDIEKDERRKKGEEKERKKARKEDGEGERETVKGGVAIPSNKKQQLSAKKLQRAKSPTCCMLRSVLSGSKKNLLSLTPGASGVAASTLSGSRRNFRTPTGGPTGIFSAAKRKLPPTNLFSNSKRKTPKKGGEDIPKIKINDRTINHQKNIWYSFEKKKRLEKIRRLSKVLEEKRSRQSNEGSMDIADFKNDMKRFMQKYFSGPSYSHSSLAQPLPSTPKSQRTPSQTSALSRTPTYIKLKTVSGSTMNI